MDWNPSKIFGFNDSTNAHRLGEASSLEKPGSTHNLALQTARSIKEVTRSLESFDDLKACFILKACSGEMTAGDAVNQKVPLPSSALALKDNFTVCSQPRIAWLLRNILDPCPRHDRTSVESCSAATFQENILPPGPRAKVNGTSLPRSQQSFAF